MALKSPSVSLMTFPLLSNLSHPSFILSIAFKHSTIRENFFLTATSHADDTDSVNSIFNPGPGTCTFYGVDGLVIVVPPHKRVPVGPPQELVSGSCV